jgi:hypothetical protein
VGTRLVQRAVPAKPRLLSCSCVNMHAYSNVPWQAQPISECMSFAACSPTASYHRRSNAC